MSHCPKCNAEYEEGIGTCADCNVAVVPGSAPEDSDENGWELLTTVGTDEEATLLAGFLEAEGIDAEIESRASHPIAETVGELAQIRILVREGKKETAKRILDSREASYDGMEDDEAVVTDDGVARLDDDSEMAD